jgi:hypothetical protein
MAPTLSVANSGPTHTHATATPVLRKRRSIRQEEIAIIDTAAAMDLVRRASINYRDASPEHVNKAARLVRVWLSSDAWVRDRIYRRTPLNTARNDTTVMSRHLKRKSGGQEEKFRIIGRSIVDGDAVCRRDGTPLTWVEKVADDELMVFSPANVRNLDGDHQTRLLH